MTKEKLHIQIPMGDSAYLAPHCDIIFISNEGLLCQSGLSGGIIHEGIGGDDSELIN